MVSSSRQVDRRVTEINFLYNSNCGGSSSRSNITSVTRIKLTAVATVVQVQE